MIQKILIASGILILGIILITQTQTITGLSTSEIENSVIIDVRTFQEHFEERIPNSILMPYDNIENLIGNQVQDKNKEIFVYCRSGRRSSIAKQKLESIGYTNVIDLGGIIDWSGPTISGAN